MSGTSIPLQFNPTAIGPNLGQSIAQAGQMLQLQQQQAQAKSQNALKSILGAPGAIDETGNPTADALSKVMAVDPATGMKLKQSSLVNQNQQLQSQVLHTKAFSEKLDLLNDAYGPVMEQYKQSLKDGTPPEQAMAVAQRRLDEENQNLQQGGMFTPQEQQNHPTKFDPVKFQQFFDGSQMVRDHIKSTAQQKKEQDDQTRADARLAEEKRYHDIEAAKLTPGTEDRRNIDVIAADQIQKAEQARGGPLTEAEKAQIRLTAADTAAAARKAQANAPIDVSPEERQAYAAQAATGQPLNNIVTGYRQDAVALRKQIHADAIKKLQEDNPGMSAADAGIELANRTIEYQSGKKSETQLNSMLGATKQAVGQLDFNIDRVNEDLGKLPSTDLSPILNSIMRGEEKWTGDPKYTDLFYHMHATAVESARILSGGQASSAQLHQGAMEEAQKWANVNMTPASFKSVAKAMKEEGESRIGTYQDAMKSQRVGGASTSTGSSGGSNPPAKKDEGTQIQTFGTSPDDLAKIAQLPKGTRFRGADGKVREITTDPKPAPGGAPAPAAAAAPGGAPAPAAAPALPPLPKGVPPGSAWSASRKMWRTPDGKILDASGKPVGGG
jgi:hypothetical protein